MIFDSFFMGASQKCPRFSKNNSIKRWDIFVKNYHSHPKGHQCHNENDYNFFSITEPVLEIDLIVYNMTKSSKIYQKIFLVTLHEN